MTGIPFFEFIREALLQPAGITDVIVSSTAAAQRATDEAICEDEGLGLSPLDLKSQLLVPAVYAATSRSRKWRLPARVSLPRRPP